MANKSDFSDLTKKLNLNGIMDNVKSIITPGGVTPKAEDGDVVGLQLAELSLKIQELAKVNAEQAKRLAEVNKLFNAVFDQLKAERELEQEHKQAESQKQNTTQSNPVQPEQDKNDQEPSS